MDKKGEEWIFLKMRAAQLYDEGNVQGALRLIERINEEQVRRLETVNKSKIVSTLCR